MGLLSPYAGRFGEPSQSQGGGRRTKKGRKSRKSKSKKSKSKKSKSRKSKGRK